MKLARVILSLSLVSVLLGCGENLPGAEQLAQCMVAKASATQLREAGSLIAAGKPLPKSLASPCLSWVARWQLEQPTWETASKQFAREATTHFEYRAGWYMQIPPEPATEQARYRAAELGLLLEQVARTRRDVLACHQVDENSIALVSQLDSTFTLGAALRYLEVQELEPAKKVAERIGGLAAVSALASTPAPCDESLDRTFREHVRQWQQFYEGKHPWLPGCRVRTEEKDFVLTCE